MSTILGKIRLLRTTAAAIAAVVLEEGRLAYITDDRALVSGDGVIVGALLPRIGFGNVNADLDMHGHAIKSSGGGGIAFFDGVATGVNSVAFHSGLASGEDSLCFGQGSAAGVGAACFGIGDADGSYSFSIIRGTSDGPRSIAMGYGAHSSGYGSMCFGPGNHSAGSYAIAFGQNGIADQQQMLVHGLATTVIPSGQYVQHVEFGLSIKTTSATPATLSLDGDTAVWTPEHEDDGDIIPFFTNMLCIPVGTALFGMATICGILSTGATASMYLRKFAIKNVAGTTAIIGSVETIGTDIEGDAAYDVAITADNTNDALQINVTGKTSETIRWLASVSGLQMTFGT